MSHSQGLSNNLYPEPIPRIDTYLFKVYLRLGLPKGLFLVGLSVNILKALLFYTILTIFHALLNLLDLITLTDYIR